MDTVGSRIRRIRELRGLSQKELATRAGIHEVLMRRYEYGDRNPKPAQLAKIADALCVSESIFHMPDVTSADAMFALLFELIDILGDVSLEERGGDISIKLPIRDKMSTYQPLHEAVRMKEKIIDASDFQRWLLNYKYSKIVTVDFKGEKISPRYPELQ